MIDEFIEFIKEREKIRYRKESGLPRPWTDDLILATGYFCNVRRDDDKVTRFLRKEWYEPNKDQEDLWFAAAVARNVNLIDTLVELGYQSPWNADRFKKVIGDKQEAGELTYNSAYLIRAGYYDGKPKHEYLADKMLTPLWENREAIRPRWGDALNDFFNRLVSQHGFGSFLAGQVVVDTSQYGLLSDAPDRFRWCVIGPGSRQGLNILMGRPLKAPWSEKDFQEKVNELQDIVNERLKFKPPLIASDIQNCLCEASKYWKAKQGIQPVKRKYLFDKR